MQSTMVCVCACARAHAKAHTRLWVNTVHPPGKSFSFALFFLSFIFSLNHCSGNSFLPSRNEHSCLSVNVLFRNSRTGLSTLIFWMALIDPSDCFALLSSSGLLQEFKFNLHARLQLRSTRAPSTLQRLHLPWSLASSLKSYLLPRSLLKRGKTYFFLFTFICIYL